MRMTIIELQRGTPMGERLRAAANARGEEAASLYSALQGLSQAIAYALGTSDAVAVCAPLGADSAVRRAAADALGVSLRVSRRAAAHMERCGGDAACAELPAGSRALLGDGPVPGCVCAVSGRCLLLLPEEEDEALLRQTNELFAGCFPTEKTAGAAAVLAGRAEVPETAAPVSVKKKKRRGDGVLRALTLGSMACFAALCIVGWKISSPAAAAIVAPPGGAALPAGIEIDMDAETEEGRGGTEIPEEEPSSALEPSSVLEPSHEVSEEPSFEALPSSQTEPSSASQEPSSAPEPSYEAPPEESAPPFEEEEPSEPEPDVSPEEEEEPSSEEEEEEPDPGDFDEELTVTVNGSRRTMDAYTLLCRLVRNEMGPSFDTEAYKAQAVASYTMIRYNNERGTAPSVGLNSDVTPRIEKAVSAVLGEAVYYRKLANTVYHSTSAGETTSAAEVWGGSLPYLVSVDSAWDEDVPGYRAVSRISASSFASKVENVYGIDLYDYSDDPADWLEIESYNSGGYVGAVSLGGRTKGKSSGSYGTKTITGRSIREVLLGYQLRSHCFEYEYDEDSDRIVFTTYGYGHGVGMSQYGAQMMALEGYDYEEILTHYYTDTVVK